MESHSQSNKDAQTFGCDCLSCRINAPCEYEVNQCVTKRNIKKH